MSQHAWASPLLPEHRIGAGDVEREWAQIFTACMSGRGYNVQ